MKAESGVLHSQSRMTAEEESRETKQKQHEGRHEARFLVYIVMKVKPLLVGGLLAGGQARRLLNLLLTDPDPEEAIGDQK